MKWSNFQQDIFEWHDFHVGSGKQSALMVTAGPGSGKSRTIEEAGKYHIPAGTSGVFLAFNADIVGELKKRMPNNDVRTIHSLGFKAIRSCFQGVEVEKEKSKDTIILENILDKYTYRKLYYPISQVASAVRNNLAETDDATLSGLIADYNIDVNGDTDIIFDATRKLLDESKKMTQLVSFDDMIWLPVVLNLAMPQYQYAAVDELQDLNICQERLIEQTVTSNGTIVGVGDRRQSIYRFRGADTESMNKFKNKFGAEELPLSITYRCPCSVVALVNSTFPDAQLIARDDAPDGEVETIKFEKANFTPGDMILCRTNAPLVNPCYALIRQGVKAVIKGKDIGQGLVALIKRMNATDIHDLIARLEDYQMKEIYRLLEMRKDYSAQVLSDKVETIYAVISGLGYDGTVYDVINAINTIFQKESAAVTFSSIHKAKGLEAERVFILHPELLPHPMAKRAEEKEQEDNLKYVAYTRPKYGLYFVADAP